MRLEYAHGQGAPDPDPCDQCAHPRARAPVHCLIIPKKRIFTLNDASRADQALLGHMLLTAARLAREAGIAEDGYRVQMNVNKGGGQVVYHIHLHVCLERFLFYGWFESRNC